MRRPSRSRIRSWSSDYRQGYKDALRTNEPGHSLPPGWRGHTSKKAYAYCKGFIRGLRVKNNR